MTLFPGRLKDLWCRLQDRECHLWEEVYHQRGPSRLLTQPDTVMVAKPELSSSPAISVVKLIYASCPLTSWTDRQTHTRLMP